MELDNSGPSNGKSSKRRKQQANDEKGKSERKRKHKSSEAHSQQSPSKHKKRTQSNGDRLPSNETLPVIEQSPEGSPYHTLTSSLYVPLPPIGLQHPLRSLCAEHLSPLILTYYEPFHGVVISYSIPRVSSNPDDISSTDGRQKVYARSIDEYAAPFVWLTADFLVLKPQKGDLCEGYISIQNESSIGLICWNFFSASIERKRLPREWTWTASDKPRKWNEELKKPSMDDDVNDDPPMSITSSNQLEDFEDDVGYYVDGNGKRITGTVNFRVKDVDTSGTTSREFDFMSIIGTMLSEDEEKGLRQQEKHAESILIQDAEALDDHQVTAGNQANGIDSMESEEDKTDGED